MLGVDFGLLALAVGAATGARGMRSRSRLPVAAGSYLVSSMAPLVSWLEPAKYASLFYWSVGDNQLGVGLSLGAFAILLGVAVVIAIVAIKAFERHDRVERPCLTASRNGMVSASLWNHAARHRQRETAWWMMATFAVCLAIVLAACVFGRRRVRNSEAWRATVTPLASVIGSGFPRPCPLSATVGRDGRHGIHLRDRRFLFDCDISRTAEKLLQLGASPTAPSWASNGCARFLLGLAYMISVGFFCGCSRRSCCKPSVSKKGLGRPSSHDWVWS